MMQSQVSEAGKKSSRAPETSTAGFVSPDWGAQEDTTARLKQMPPDANAKGMFLWSVAETMAQWSGKKAPNYIRFKDYPIREFVELAVETVRVAFPRVPLKEGLRRLGQQVYPMFKATLVGGTIFGIAARDWPSTLALIPRAYPISIQPGTADLIEVGERQAIIQLRQVWSFPDSYQVGVFEGTMHALGVNGTVKLRNVSLCDADLLLSW